MTLGGLSQEFVSYMRRLPIWLAVVLVLIIVAGCVPETLPKPQVPADSITIAEPGGGTASELAAEPTVSSSPTAEALREILESELLETPAQLATVTPILEEVLQLKPPSSKPNADALQRINYAKNDLATRLGIDSAGFELIAFEKVIWRDGSLGCPQPDLMYTQALVEGYLIQIQVSDQAYNYHGANGRDPFLCGDGASNGDGAGGSESSPGIFGGGKLDTPPVQGE